MEHVANQHSIPADTRLCERCGQLDLSMASRNLSVERNALAQRAGSLGRYTPMTDVGVRVAGLGDLSRVVGVADCLLCRLIDRHRQCRDPVYSLLPYQADSEQFFYAFSAQHCFQETGMGLDRNFLVVLPDLDRDETYGMEPVVVNGRRIHGINHKLHPDFTRLDNRYIVCQKPSEVSRYTGARPRAISEKLDVSIVKQWLEDCQASHGSCSSSCSDELKLDDYLPDIKLIDCKKRIVIAAKDIDQRDPPSYVALSYVWGSTYHPPIQTNAHLPVVLPQVIEDAIHVTLATGYHYLWVDQYCIDQKDTPHKSQQIKIMDRIYSSAAWTMVDGAGGDASYGLVGISRPRSEDLGPVDTKNEVELYHWPSHSTQILNQSKWATRAWTYQEAFFSRRIVIFTASGLYFECQETYEHEGLIRNGDESVGNASFKKSMDDNRASASSLFPKYDYGPLTRSSEPWTTTTEGNGPPDGANALHAFWRRVEEYTCRQVTFPEDSLAAFRGFLQSYARRAPTNLGSTPLASVCGIPFPIPPITTTTRPAAPRELSMGLCWSHAHGSTSRRRPSFPSWSWAGWTGQSHGGSHEPVESLLWGISFESVDGNGATIKKPPYEMDGQDSEVLLLEANILPPDALLLTGDGQWDVFGLGPHARFDMDEHIRNRVISRGLREGKYVIVPVVLLNGSRARNKPSASTRMLLLRRNLDSWERVGLFICGSSSISFKLITLINQGRFSWDRKTLRVI